MCGRYASSRSGAQLALNFRAELLADTPDLKPDYNVAPTKNVYLVRESERDGERRRVVSTARWGLVPSWAKDPAIGNRMLNARAESVTEKPAYRRAFERRRALVPADGWYEWAKREHGPGKQPYYMTRRDGEPLAFAGLWEVWGESDDRLLTCTIVTTHAVGAFADVHDRMPLVLAPEDWDVWLGEATGDPKNLLSGVKENFLSDVELRPVGPDVGDVRKNDVDLTARIETDKSQATLF